MSEENVNAVDTTTQSAYSRLLGWYVENFMSIEKGKVEFDGTNIINIKGYNDSGKSAMLRAFEVLCSNAHAKSQVGFIQDGKDYFRVVAFFSDGVKILRDKYINGQSLYEMYKGDTLIFTTKKDNVLTKVSEVPQIIVDYLGLVTYDGVCLNHRSCFEKQLGVQTTGGENYKLFNKVLKSEEIARASEMLNNDKNKLLHDIGGAETQIEANKSMLGRGVNISEDMINFLKEHDRLIDIEEQKESELSQMVSLTNDIDSIPILPELPFVEDITELVNIVNIYTQLKDTKITPELPEIDAEQLNVLMTIKNNMQALNEVKITPELPEIENQQLLELIAMIKVIKGYVEAVNNVNDIDKKLTTLSSEKEDLLSQAKDTGVKLATCPNCGEIFNVETGHIEGVD